MQRKVYGLRKTDPVAGAVRTPRLPRSTLSDDIDISMSDDSFYRAIVGVSLLRRDEEARHQRNVNSYWEEEREREHR